MTVMTITPVIERKALELAARNGVSLDQLIEDALVRLLEDEEDIALLEEALRDPEAGTRISHEQMMRELGLDA